MTEKDVKRLSRADLLEMLIEATEELEATNAKLVEMEAKLKEKDQQLFPDHTLGDLTGIGRTHDDSSLLNII